MLNRKRFAFIVSVFVLVTMLVAPVMAQESVDINVWIAFTDFRLDWAKERAAEFTEMFPQWNIVIQEYTDYEPLLDAYTLAQEQGNPPQVIQLFEVGTQFAIDSGWFKPVNEIINGREEVNGVPVDFDDIIPVISSYYSVDGEWASVAWNTSTPIFYANKTMMDKIGLETIPATWQDIEAACELFQPMVDAGEITGCITWPNHGWFFEQWLAQQDTLLVNNVNGREGRATEVDLTSPAALNIAQWHQDMYNKGYYAYSGVQRDWTGTVQAFSAQQLPFIMTSSASAGGITSSALENGFEVITSLMPHDAEVPYTGNILGGATMWITDGLDSNVEEGALTFLLWFSNTENSADWHKISGYVPIRQSSVDLLESEGWYEENPNFLVASTQLANSQVTPATRGAIFGTFVETRNVITQALEDVMLLGGDPMEILSKAQEEANALLEEYNLLYVE